MGRKQLITFLVLSLSFSLYSQSTISGTVTDSLGITLPNINVTLNTTETNTIISYTFTDFNGKYALKTNKIGNFNLIVNGLGLKKSSTKIQLDSTKTIIKNITLFPSNEQLEEVIIKTKSPITIKNDTVVFQVNRFLKGNEQTVEDLLKNIPGLEIDTEGTIKVNGKEVEKVMVEGDDFFEKGYKILTKNMPSQPIKEVELLQNYSNNRLLKGIEESDKTTLNLKLKDDAKRVWFGNIKAGHDIIGKNNYDVTGNLMNFGKKNKYYFLTNLNNIGHDATGNINHLIKPFILNEPSSIGNNQSANKLLNVSASVPNFKKSRTNFNNAELLSLNAIFNPIDKLKIKTLAFLNWDEIDFFRNSTSNFIANNTNFTNIQDYILSNKKSIGFGKLDVVYNISKTKMLEATTKFNDGSENGNTNLLFNSNSTTENLKTNNSLLDQKISYSNKYKSNKALLITGRFINENSPQVYTNNQFLFEDLFTNSDSANNVKQTIENSMLYLGLESHILDRKQNSDLLELKLGNEFRKDDLVSRFEIKENQTVINSPQEYINNTKYTTNDLYFKSKYRLKINDFALVGKLDFHQFFNTLKQSNTEQKQSPFFVNPSFGFDWKLNDINKITTSYSYNTTNAKILDVYSNYILNGFRNFTKGTGDFNQLDSQSLFVNYQLGNWGNRFFANTFITYTKNHDFFSTNSIVQQNYSQAEKILIKNREFLNISSALDYYLKFIASNIKVKLGYSKSNFKNIVNNSNLRTVKSSNNIYGLELRSGFKGIFNYHLGSNWLASKIETSGFKNSFTNNTSFLDLSFVFSKKFDFKTQFERYYFGNIDSNDNTYYFLDLDSKYVIKKNKLSLFLAAKNLFNTESFKNFSVNDLGNSTTEYRLLPRYALLKLEYRF